MGLRLCLAFVCIEIFCCGESRKKKRSKAGTEQGLLQVIVVMQNCIVIVFELVHIYMPASMRSRGSSG